MVCNQDGQEFSAYFGRFKIVWDDLDDYEPKTGCCCNNSNFNPTQTQQASRSWENFLMGLDALNLAPAEQIC